MKKNETSQKEISNLQLTHDFSQQNLRKELHKNTDIITSLIHEYLLKKEYYQSLDSFQEDIARKLRQKNYYKPTFLEITTNGLIKSFSRGNKPDFFKQWNRLIPNHIKLRESFIQNTEFYIEVYFAIYPLLYKDSFSNNGMNIKESMNKFRGFLENKKYELSKNSEFLQYYALPYIPNPQTHPNYTNLFRPEWTIELKDKIKLCVKKYLPAVNYPVLYELVINDASNSQNANISSISQPKNQMKNFLENLSNQNNENDIYSPEEDLNNSNENESFSGNRSPFGMINMNMDINANTNRNINTNYNSDELIKLKEENTRLKQKARMNKLNVINIQRSWTKLTQDILTNSFNLVFLCQSNRGLNEIIFQSDKLNKKLQKYQEFINKTIEKLDKQSKTYNTNNTNLSNIQDKNDFFFENTVANSKYGDISGINNIFNTGAIENKIFTNDSSQPHLIDMVSLIHSLKNLNEENATQNDDHIKLAFIIREIRIRIFRRNNMKIKILTLYSVFYYDLIYKNNILQKVLKLSSLCSMLTLEMMKLVNRISSLTKGRNYLLMNKNASNFIEDIVNCMMKEKGDTELRKNCLGTIQNFTLRVEPQNKLISLNIIKWIIDIFIYESKSLSDYTIEYGLSLLMNLSLRKDGRDKFESEAERIIQIMINYFNKESTIIQTCVNGTLYSLLKRKKFVEEAKKFNLENIIKSANITDPQLKKQLGYIIEELNVSEDKLNKPDADENFEEDPTAIENDNTNLLDEDYAEMDSIDEEMLKNHNKYLTEFTIKNDDVNEEEEQKIEMFSRNNPSMIMQIEQEKQEGNAQMNSSNSGVNVNDQLGEKILDNNLKGTNEYANVEIEDNGKVNDEKKEVKNEEENKENKENNNEGNYDKDMDIAQAFEKRDKILRTPPGEEKEFN